VWGRFDGSNGVVDVVEVLDVVVVSPGSMSVVTGGLVLVITSVLLVVVVVNAALLPEPLGSR
jgi:hypothetical protein